MIRFSLIIPVYNVAPYLCECLDSLLAQSVVLWEAICIDDGSTDGSGKILDDYAQKDARFVVCHQKNEGVSVARNRAMALSRGQYIGFVDGDDVLDKHWLEAAYDAFVLSNADMVKMRVRRIREGSEYVKPSVVAVYSKSNLWEWSCLRGGLTVQNFYKQDVLNRVRFPIGMRIYEDGIFNLYALRRVKVGAQSEYDGYWYRPSETSSFNQQVSEGEYCRLIEELGTWYVLSLPYLKQQRAEEIAHSNLARYINSITDNWFAQGALIGGDPGRRLAVSLKDCGARYQIDLSRGSVLRKICRLFFVGQLSKFPYAAYVRLIRFREHMRDRRREKYQMNNPTEHIEVNRNIVAYAAWHNNPKVLQKCTSGGVATALAEMIIKKGGIVVGAAYAENMVVRHIIIDNEGDLKRIQGVKYVRSMIGREVFDGMTKSLKQQRNVLFVGLPCQVAAMRKRFGNAPNLILVDLVCFGAPSQKVWLKYVSWLEQREGRMLKAVNPRDKKYGYGRRSYYRYDWVDGHSSFKMSLFDPYAQAFYSAIAFCNCCYACQFRGDGHLSDLTIGDCWGAETVKEFLSIIKNGISLVVCHNNLGLRVLQGAQLELKVVKPEFYLSKNRPYYESPIRTKRAISFCKDVDIENFETLIHKYNLKVTYLSYVRRRFVLMAKLLIKKFLP